MRRCWSRIILHRILMKTATCTRPTRVHLCRPRARQASRARYAAALPENLDTQIQQFLKDHDTAPLQGISESVQAIAAATVFGRQRKKYLTQPGSISVEIVGRTANSVTLDEWQGKKLLENVGIPIPAGGAGHSCRCLGCR